MNFRYRVSTLFCQALSFWTALTAISIAATEPKVCQLTPFHTGVCQIGKDHVLGSEYTADERLPFVIYSFLVESPSGDRALVDLGPKTVTYCNRMFRTHGFFRDLGEGIPQSKRYPDDIVQPHGNVFTQLSRANVSVDSIGHIVFTHLHADHHGMDDATNGGSAEAFKNAVLHVSRRGWDQNLAKRTDGRWNSYVDYAFSDFLMRQSQVGRVRFEDNREVFPGLSTMYLGGHSECSQAVLVETSAGLAIITSDELYLFQLLEDRIIPQIRTTERRYRQALNRLVDLAERRKGIFIPMHDPVVWQTYVDNGDHWLVNLRERTVAAIAEFRR